MGMPQIPDGTNRPSAEEVFIDLLESIALEEMALSHILNAEGEKLQAIIEKFKTCELSFNGLDKATKGVNRTIRDLIIKEWLLLTKLDSIKDYCNNNEMLNNCVLCSNCKNNEDNEESNQSCKNQYYNKK